MVSIFDNTFVNLFIVRILVRTFAHMEFNKLNIYDKDEMQKSGGK